MSDRKQAAGRKTRVIATEWTELVLVCRKCSRKVKGGFGPDGDKPLRKALKSACGGAKGRRGRLAVVEVGCFDVCPKGAVMVVRGSRPDQLLMVPSGMPVKEVAERLGLVPDRGQAET